VKVTSVTVNQKHFTPKSVEFVSATSMHMHFIQHGNILCEILH